MHAYAGVGYTMRKGTLDMYLSRYKIRDSIGIEFSPLSVVSKIDQGR